MNCFQICIFVTNCTMSEEIHAHVERDRTRMRTTMHRTRFNPHAHVGRDLLAVDLQWIGQVSIHTPTWDVTHVIEYLCKLFVVSIHTPTWDVTNLPIDKIALVDVSIHTPTWGVTTVFISFPTCGMFQSTRPRGA